MGLLWILMLCFGIDLSAGACTDSVTRKNILNVLNDKGRKIDVAESCREVMKKWPGLCEHKLVGGNRGRCCKSCGDTKCLDKLTSANSLTIGSVVEDVKVTSCRQLVNKYKVLCRKEGKRGGNCCRECKKAGNLKCLDDLKIYPVDGKYLNCARYVKADPCRCTDNQVKKDCCQSCRSVSTSHCSCTDSLSKTNSAAISIVFEDFVFSRDVTDCRDISKWYSQFCTRDKLGGKNNACCETCKTVDPECSDNLLWKASLDNCRNCNCHDFRQKGGVQLMKKVCRQDIRGDNMRLKATSACCLQCKHVGF